MVGERVGNIAPETFPMGGKRSSFIMVYVSNSSERFIV